MNKMGGLIQNLLKDQKRKGRPIFKFSTSPKTWCFFDSDINELLNNGWSPKEIFRLGILAKKENPQLINRIAELEETNKKLAEKLQKASKLIYEIKGEVDLK